MSETNGKKSKRKQQQNSKEQKQENYYKTDKQLANEESQLKKQNQEHLQQLNIVSWVPNNNRYNYFFKNNFNHFNQYDDSGYLPQLNYKYMDCKEFIAKVNRMPSMQFYYQIMGLLITISLMLVVVLLSIFIDIKFITYIGVVAVFGLLCLNAYLAHNKIFKLNQTLRKENITMKKGGKDVRWFLGPNGQYLHLCVKFSTDFHPQGEIQMNHEPYEFGGVMINASQDYTFDDEFYIKAEKVAQDEADAQQKSQSTKNNQSIVIQANTSRQPLIEKEPQLEKDEDLLDDLKKPPKKLKEVFKKEAE